MRIIPILFLAIIVSEIYLFVEIGGILGITVTIFLILSTAIAAVILFRLQGFRVLTETQLALSTGTFPVTPIVHGFGILIAGALLIIPGFFTDFIGIIFFVPSLRAVLTRVILRKVMRIGAFNVTATANSPSEAGPIIDGEYSVKTSCEHSEAATSLAKDSDPDTSENR
ncbi:MAG: membrane protein FxsA [Rhodospirillaceae bacterium]|nr:membrane protein FxsA [Rhodospirillaceae bacterium]|tara:strand:- start:4701 stop:5207 length:507 start_codon:yes stop_codon:yes gene_type:complete